LESYVFLTEHGDFLGEMKAVYDHPVTETITLQPRIGLNLAAQDVPELGLASGFTDAELGLRLRYELTDLLAPYVGVSHERLLGKTVNIARAAGDTVRSTHFVVGFSSSF
jgi:copper resistance protein B